VKIWQAVLGEATSFDSHCRLIKKVRISQQATASVNIYVPSAEPEAVASLGQGEVGVQTPAKG